MLGLPDKQCFQSCVTILSDNCSFFPLNLFIYLFIYGCVGSLLLCGLSLVVVSGGYSSLRCGARAYYGGFSCGAQALGAWASVAVARELTSCGARA